MFDSFQQRWWRLWESGRRNKAILSEFLRAIGLRSFAHIRGDFRYWFRNLHRPEAPKQVLRRSRLYAICRSAVHLTPMIVLAWLLVLNYKKLYYGPGLSIFNRSDAAYFALYQIAAKLIELVCVASLCTILLHVLRDDLLHGDGVSLGLLTSSSWFSSPNYLWSPEFITAVQTSLTLWWRFWRHPNNIRHLGWEEAAVCWRRTRLAILLPILMLIAALIGPAAAVLLIPRSQQFTAGGTDYFLNATFDEMWPSVVSADFELDICSGANATLYPVCPSGGYNSFRYQGGFNGIYDASYFHPSQTADNSLWFISSLVLDRLDLVPAILAVGTDRLGQRPWMPTYISQPNLYTAIIQQALYRDWASAIYGPFVPNGFMQYYKNYKYATAVSASTPSTHPITHVRCSVPQNLPSEAEVMGFHFVGGQPLKDSEHGWSQDNVTKPVNIAALRRDPTTHVRAQWIPLSIEDFGPVSTGLLFELPWSTINSGRSRVAISCTVAASWGQARHARSESSNYYAWFVDPGAPNSDSYVRNITINTTAADVQASKYNRHVQLTSEWLGLLSPSAPDPPSTNDSWRPSTLENIFHAAGFDTLMQELRTEEFYTRTTDGTDCSFGKFNSSMSDLDLWVQPLCYKENRVSFIERTIARLVTDGLSRRLSHRGFTMVPNVRSWITSEQNRNRDYDLKLLKGDRNPSQNAIIMSNDSSLITQRLEIAVNGYGYQASSRTDYLATVVVAAYLIISFIHVIWVVCYKPVTSISWDSALELVLLAYNSAPEPRLLGTSAAIKEWDTYKRTVKVRAVQTDSPASEIEANDPAPHLHLIVEADDIPHVRKRTKRNPSEQILLDPENTTEMLHTNPRPLSVSHDAMSQISMQSADVGSQTTVKPAQYLLVEIGKKYY